MFKIGDTGLNRKAIIAAPKTETDILIDEKMRLLRERLLGLAKKPDDKHTENKDSSPKLLSQTRRNGIKRHKRR